MSTKQAVHLPNTSPVNDDFRTLVEARVDPVMWTGMCALIEAFELHNAVLYKDKITNLVMTGDEDDTAMITDRTIGILYQQAEALLQQMKIELDLENIRIGLLADFIEALHFVRTDLDHEILAIIQQCEDTVDGLVEILALKMNKIPEEIMEYVVSCSFHTINAIQEVVQASVQAEEYNPDEMVIVLGSLNKHQALVGTGMTAAMEALSEGDHTGVTMQTLVDKFSDRLQTSSQPEVVDHLISMALLAKTPSDAVEDEVLFFLEQIYHDVVDLQKSRRLLVARLKEMGEAYHE